MVSTLEVKFCTKSYQKSNIKITSYLIQINGDIQHLAVNNQIISNEINRTEVSYENHTHMNAQDDVSYADHTEEIDDTSQEDHYSDWEAFTDENEPDTDTDRYSFRIH